MKKKIYCSHRGFNSVAPENTLPAVASAVSLGAEEIEFDLWPTADGEIVVCHDPTVDRTTDGTGSINEMTADEVRKCDAGVKFGREFAGVKIPFFEEVLEQFANRTVMNIHIKSLGYQIPRSEAVTQRLKALGQVYTENAPLAMPMVQPKEVVLPEMEQPAGARYSEEVFGKILALIDKYQCRENVYVTGCQDVLETARKMAPDVKRCCLEGDMNFTIVEHAIEYECSRVQFCKLFLTQQMIDKAHAHGMICNLFWSDDPEEAEGFFNMGIDVMLTNHFLRVQKKR